MVSVGAWAARRRLAEGLAEMVTDLNHLPVAAPPWRACTLRASAPTSYLIRLRYGDARVSWIGTADDANQCVPTTNGTLRTWSYIGDTVGSAYQEGRWPSLTPPDECEPGPGRIGQDRQLVPEGSIGLTVCGLSVKAPQRKSHGADTAKKVAAEIDSLRAERFDGACRPGRGSAIRLVFRYAQGPPAAVTVWGTECGMENTFLRGALSAELMDELSGLLD
ncbi:hypothetical protein GCM10023259_030880 [Thermocatellispora tengchongensis]